MVAYHRGHKISRWMDINGGGGRAGPASPERAAPISTGKFHPRGHADAARAGRSAEDRLLCKQEVLGSNPSRSIFPGKGRWRRGRGRTLSPSGRAATRRASHGSRSRGGSIGGIDDARGRERLDPFHRARGPRDPSAEGRALAERFRIEVRSRGFLAGSNGGNPSHARV